jgi:4-hydroxyphenylpyruvate dioxygenase
MRRAIATASMVGTLREKLEAAAAARFEAVELSESDFIAFRGTAREARRIAEDLGVAFDLYKPSLDFEAVPAEQFEHNLERAERNLDLLESLGVPTLGLTANSSPAALADPALAAEHLHALADRAARRNLRVAFGASPTSRWIRTYQDAWSILQQATHAHLGLRLDSFHTLLTSAGELEGIRAIPGNQIFFVAMADGQRARGDGGESSWHRAFPAQGELDVVSFLENVLISGYGGTVCLESAHDFFRAIPNRRTATDAMRSLLFLESVVRQRLERPAAETASAAVPRRILSNVSLFDPPDPPPLGGFSFVEFGIDADTALRLAAVFQKLGFARFGRHRTKDVTLYRQGDIHLLLNADLGSDARRRFEERGACVCCLGLLADNPAQAANRGTALLSARHEGRRGPQELPLPTIVAPGGTLLQFVPPPFDTVEADFISEPPPVPVTDCGLKTVDHVAMRLGVEQLDTWVLFTSAVLGLTPAAGVQIAEPFGLIRSRGVSNDSRRVRMVLNAAISRVGVRGGGGVPPTPPSGDVEYIALGCDDIFQAVGRLRANGVAFVSLSRNYYDDLVSRVSLAPSVVDRMRGLDIAYDNTGGGDYFHAYTDAFEGRFHFQIVQRQHYDGYGAGNAPARAASVEQTRHVQEWFNSVL